MRVDSIFVCYLKKQNIFVFIKIIQEILTCSVGPFVEDIFVHIIFLLPSWLKYIQDAQRHIIPTTHIAQTPLPLIHIHVFSVERLSGKVLI